jgi:hypothetical protein
MANFDASSFRLFLWPTTGNLPLFSYLGRKETLVAGLQLARLSRYTSVIFCVILALFCVKQCPLRVISAACIPTAKERP